MEYEKPNMNIFELEARDVFMSVSNGGESDSSSGFGNDDGNTEDGF